jgi:CPA2 family monovalent cation:H+ antiporter-2
MEPGSLDISLYKHALIVLGAAGVVIPVFHRLHISSVLGFILIGIVVGPFGLASLTSHLPWLSAITISQPQAIEPIARLGVVLLLFMIGLELSFERLWVMRRLVFGLGALQVVLCAAMLAAAAAMLGYSRIGTVVIGLALAMSSTAVVLQVLSEEKRLNTSVGRTSFGILLFQDLAVVPVLFVLSMIAPTTHAGSAGFGLVVGQALLAIAAIVALGRLVLRPLFRSVARTRSAEVFVAACLLVVIVTGLATAAAGLSMALGALIGGLLLAGTEYRRQVEITIEPFKGLSVGVFLIAIGMSLDIRTVGAHPSLVLVTAGGLVLLKLLVVTILSHVSGLNWANSLQTGLLLGPGGEFAFVIVSAARVEHLLAPDTASVMLFVTALAMASIPLLSRLGDRIAPRLALKTPVDPTMLVPAKAFDVLPRVIVAGFGRVGQTVAAMLEIHQVPYVAIDRDPDRVARQREHGAPVYFGDITQIELLRRLHLETARALVVTLDDPAAADELVASARAAREDLVIVARARDAGHAAHLYQIGASDAVPETIEASLQLSEAVLVDVGMPIGPVIASIHDKRAALQAEIKAMAPKAQIRALGRRRLRDRL